jgi:hypothetical protein
MWLSLVLPLLVPLVAAWAWLREAGGGA